VRFLDFCRRKKYQQEEEEEESSDEELPMGMMMAQMQEELEADWENMDEEEIEAAKERKKCAPKPNIKP